MSIHGLDFVPKFRQVWSRSDEAHVTAENIDELWQLVELPLPQDTACSRDSRVSGAREARPALMLGVSHGAKLQKLEFPTASSDTILAEQYRTVRGQFDECSD